MVSCASEVRGQHCWIGGWGGDGGRGGWKILLAFQILSRWANVSFTVNYVSAVLEQEGGTELIGFF